MASITVNGQYEVAWQPGMTVQDVLDALQFSFRLIVVKLDGEFVPRERYGDTPVPEGARLQAIHMTAGG